MLDSKQQESVDYLANAVFSKFVSVHMQHTATMLHDEIIYDPTDDGPEVSIIRLVNGSKSRW